VLGLDRQALAAFGAACVQYSAAANGCHAGAKTVSTLATDNGRLVGTFHFVVSLFCKGKLMQAARYSSLLVIRTNCVDLGSRALPLFARTGGEP
jgi:hypothetical protein